MKAYEIRSATVDDSKHIQRLVRAALVNPTGLEWSRFVVAVTPKGEIIGCGQIKPHRDGSEELASIVVEPPWQGRGVARGIIEHLLASQQGTLHLMCRSALGPLYEKFGFRELEFDEMPKYFQRVSRLTSVLEILRKEGETLLVMRR